MSGRSVRSRRVGKSAVGVGRGRGRGRGMTNDENRRPGSSSSSIDEVLSSSPAPSDSTGVSSLSSHLGKRLHVSSVSESSEGISENGSLGSVSPAPASPPPKRYYIASRPESGFGKRGTPIDLRTNSFVVKIPKDLYVHTYSVKVTERAGQKTYDYGESRCNRLMRARRQVKSFLGFHKLRQAHPQIFDSHSIWFYDTNNLAFSMQELAEKQVKLSIKYNLKNGEPINLDFVIAKSGEAVPLMDMIPVICRNLEEQELDPTRLLDIMFSQIYFEAHCGVPHNFPAYIPSGRAFCKPVRDDRTGRCVDLGKGRELWAGIVKTHKPILGAWNYGSNLTALPKARDYITAVEVDRAYTGFLTPDSCLNHMMKLTFMRQVPKGQLDYRTIGVLNLHMRNIFVKANLGNGKVVEMNVYEVSKEPADKLIYDKKDKSRMTVAQYFQKTYNIRLQYPKLPCLMKQIGIGPKLTKKPFPMELCSIVENQRLSRSKCNDGEFTSTMIRSAAKPADQTSKMITDALREAVNNNPFMKQLRLHYDMDMMSVVGRVLPQYDVKMRGRDKKERFIRVMNDGNFRVDGCFFEAASIKSYAMISIPWPEEYVWNPRNRNGGSPEETNDILRNFCQNFVGEARKLGMQMPNWPTKIRESDSNPIHFVAPPVSDGEYTFEYIKNYMEGLLREASADKFDLIVFVCPETKDKGRQGLSKIRSQYAGEVYKYMKYCCRYVLNVPSQCLVPSTLVNIAEGGRGAQTAVQLLQKVNTKLGGVNWVAIPDTMLQQFLNNDFMVVGADVAHPSVNNRRDASAKDQRPSVAAVTASMDFHAMRYASNGRYQFTCEEVIQNLTDIMVELFQRFRQKNKKYPKRVYFFRDGIDEGRFQKVLDDELYQIEEATKQLGFEAKISFIVAVKRHRTKFFKEEVYPYSKHYIREVAQMKDSQKNVPAGTVVDTGPVHPQMFSFFLMPHTGIKGTTRPCKFIVLQDQNRMSSDVAQSLAHFLCHCFPRCAKPVSLPAPVFWAHHLAAWMQKNVLDQIVADEGSSVCSGDSGIVANQKEALKMFNAKWFEGIKYVDSMFYA